MCCVLTIFYQGGVSLCVHLNIEHSINVDTGMCQHLFPYEKVELGNLYN